MILPLNESIKQTRHERKPNKWTVITRSILVLLMVQFILGALGAFISLLLFGPEGLASLSGEQAARYDVYFSLFSSLVNLLAILLLSFYVEGRSWQSLGLGKAEKKFLALKSALLSLLPLAFLVLLFVGFGQLEIRLNPDNHIFFSLLLLLGFFFQALFQEILFRGYIMNGLAVDGKVSQAIWVNSLMQAAFYLVNGNLSLVGTVNIFLFAMILSYVFYLTSDLRVSLAINAITQVMLGPVLGSNFQGQVYSYSFFNTVLVKNGEAFAFDQCIITSMVLALVLASVHVSAIKNQSRGNRS